MSFRLTYKKTRFPLRNLLENVMLALVAALLLHSCSSPKEAKTGTRSLAGDSIMNYLRGGNNYKGISLEKSWSSAYAWPFIVMDPPDHNFFFNPYNNGRSGAEYSVSGEVVDGSVERRQMMELGKKYQMHPDKSKYAAELNKKYSKLMQKREKRINRKLKFLKELYTYLSIGNIKKFNRQCQRHCSNMVLHELRDLCKTTENDTPFWYLFCNPEEQAPKKIQICHIKYSDHNVAGLKQFYPIIYGDSTKWNNDKIPYSDADARWYLVTLDKSPLLLRLEGTGSFILITGIINPAMNLAYCETSADIIPRMGL